MTLQKWCIVQHNKNYLVIASSVYKYSPTIEYASKGKQAEFEYEFLKEFKEADNVRRAEIIAEIFEMLRILNRRNGINNGADLGRRANNGNVQIYSGKSGRKPSAAFISCLFNSSKIRERNLKDSAISPETLDILIDKYSKDKLNDAWITNISANDYFS